MSDPALLLDTHIWFRYQVTPNLLKSSTLETIDNAALRNAVFVSAISIWELAMLERDGKLELHGGADRWSQAALSKPGIALLPLTPQIAVASVYLPEPMHKDPSDRILVASARVERLTLVTSDRKIIQFAAATHMACLQG